MQLGEIENPASGGAVQIGHVDEHLVDFFGGEALRANISETSLVPLINE